MSAELPDPAPENAQELTIPPLWVNVPDVTFIWSLTFKVPPETSTVAVVSTTKSDSESPLSPMFTVPPSISNVLVDPVMTALDEFWFTLSTP